MRTLASRRLILSALGAGLVFGLVACEQRTVIEGHVRPGDARASVRMDVFVNEVQRGGTFERHGELVTVRCTTAIVGRDGGRTASATADIEVGARGPKGSSYAVKCTDPLVLQLPSDAHDVEALATWPGRFTASLPLRAGLSAIDIAPRRQLRADPGHQLVVVDYTPDIPSGTYDLQLNFALDRSRSIDVKAVVVAEVTCDGREFLPPVLPRVTRMSQLPSFELPLSPTPVQIQPDVRQVRDVSVTINCFAA